MNYTISDYPGTYLTIELRKDEKIIVEKGTLIYCDGEYTFAKKIEAKSYKSVIAKMSGKSFSYNVYGAKEPLKIVFSAKDTAEIFSVEVDADVPVFFEPCLHFARTEGLEVSLVNKDWKSTLSDGLKLKTAGAGTLFLKGYGRVIELDIDSEKAMFVDENALIAFEERLDVRMVSRGVKDILTSGEGFLFAVRGKGRIWLQTREKMDFAGSGGIGGIVDTVFGG
ncbi:MAG TPA: AIM24 family protein [Patescibacteria group bacterium]|nr:AIM24 family protein [Patescibacteria group bacterium]